MDFQETLKQLMKALEAGEYSYHLSQEDKVLPISTEHKHSWKLYDGFTEKYHFCETCDEKKL